MLGIYIKIVEATVKFPQNDNRGNNSPRKKVQHFSQDKIKCNLFPKKNTSTKFYNINLLSLFLKHKTRIIDKRHSGAAEACWAHNPEVDGSKPSSATFLLLIR